VVLLKSTDILEQCTAFIIRANNKVMQENGTKQMTSTATLVNTSFLLGLFFHPEDVGSMSI
jgi:hypothetical protein